MKNALIVVMAVLTSFTMLRAEETKVAQVIPNGVHHYGENVYYFPETGNAFAGLLAWFLSKNPHLEVSAIAPHTVRANRTRDQYRSDADYKSDYTATVGYFVTCREKVKVSPVPAPVPEKIEKQ